MEDAKELAILQGFSTDVSKEERPGILELVRRWGGCTTDAVLDPSMQFFSLPGISGFVSYRLAYGCAIIFGEPICAPTDKAVMAEAFHRFAEKQGKSIIYVAASKEFAHWAIQNVCGALIEFGEELILDPSCDPRKRTGTHGSLVRRKVKGALRESVTIHEYLGRDSELERSLEQVGEQWLQSRKGTQIHISDVYLFDDRKGKRWFYAKQGDQYVGTITLNQLQARKGWLLNHLMVTPEAPNGTSELLVVSALEVLEKEGCRFVTVGMVTAGELGEIVGLGKFSAKLGRAIFKLAKKVAHLDGLNTFWGKFHPQSEPAYVLFSQKRIGFREIMALKSALCGEKNG